MPQDRQISFGEAVKARRTALGLSQPQLAENSGIDQAQISKIERNKIADPGVSIAHRLARGLSCTVEQLMGSAAAVSMLPAPGAPTSDAIAVLQEQLEKIAVTARTALELAERHEVQLSRRRKSAAAS